MSKASSRPGRFPWMLLLILIATVGVFWILPYYRGTQEVKVEFDPPAPATAHAP